MFMSIVWSLAPKLSAQSKESLGQTTRGKSLKIAGFSQQIEVEEPGKRKPDKSGGIIIYFSR